MSSSFFQGERNSTLSSEDSPHEAPQSGQGGGCDSNTGTSYRDGGGGGAGLCDGSTVKEGSSIKAPIVDKDTSSLLKTELILGSHGMPTLKQ